MKFKLDENFGSRTRQIFLNAGHDVQTVREEALSGSSDQLIYETCRAEQRCLVTLDLDFADVVRFQPVNTSGIAVIRVPRNPTVALLEALIHQMLQALATMSVEGNLWIVEVGRIRVHQKDMND